MTASRWRWLILAGIYAVFLFWYGGSGDPISPGEVEEYLAIAREKNPEGGDRERGDGNALVTLREFMETDDGQEFVMVNLNVYRDAALYADGRESSGDAEEAQLEYQRRIAPHLLIRATHPLLMVEPAVSLGGIGEFERQDWSRVNLVRYRSRRDFLDFILKTSWAQDANHKWAALGRSHALAATPRTSFVTVRLVPLLFLIVIGLLLDRIGARSRAARPPESG